MARTHDVIGALLVDQNAYPRDAVYEALLRFIEEDLDKAQGLYGNRLHSPGERNSKNRQSAERYCDAHKVTLKQTPSSLLAGPATAQPPCWRAIA